MATDRPYTGWDGNSNSRRAGVEELIRLIRSQFGLWNNGSWVVRPMRGKSSPSVHGTGRAVDLSWRGGSYPGTGRYADAQSMCGWLSTPEVADRLGVELILDYWPQPHGRGWRCDRQTNGRGGWNQYTSKVMSGSPGGDWVHVEVSNMLADDAVGMRAAFESLLGGSVTPAPDPAPHPSPTDAVWLQRGDRGGQVAEAQRLLGVTADGVFGPNTEAAVRRFQAEQDLMVDGIIGPQTWERLHNQQPGLPYPGTPLRVGSRGADVVEVQRVVGVGADGIFGAVTERAVRAWQRAHRLVADGVVGPRTWEEMFPQ